MVANGFGSDPRQIVDVKESALRESLPCAKVSPRVDKSGEKLSLIHI